MSVHMCPVFQSIPIGDSLEVHDRLNHSPNRDYKITKKRRPSSLLIRNTLGAFRVTISSDDWIDLAI